MNNRMIIVGISLLMLVLLLNEGCAVAEVEAEPSRDSLTFAGQSWQIKQGDELMGPGPNYFSADPRDVWVDEDGNLHLTVHKRDGRWLSTEVVCDQPAGYGTYEFRLAGTDAGASEAYGAGGKTSGETSGETSGRGGGPDQLDPNIVLGLFTWDNESWQTDANSEIDIELTRWCEADAPNLHYSVHPAWGPDGKHPERFNAETIDLKGQASTHVITWMPDYVECAAYVGGDGPNADKLICKWRFDSNNPPRVVGDDEGNTSDPILIPKPHATTTIRLNLWLVDANRDKVADPPTDGKPAEVVVTWFKYNPHKD